VPRKGQDQLIRAWPRVLRDVPDARLVIVGPDRTNNGCAPGDAVPCPDRVLVTGGVPRDEVPLYSLPRTCSPWPSRTGWPAWTSKDRARSTWSAARGCR